MPRKDFNRPISPRGMIDGNKAPGRTLRESTELTSAHRDSPNGGLRDIRRRNGVDVDGPPQIRRSFAQSNSMAVSAATLDG